MRPQALLKIALRSRSRNKLRSFLNMLGIIIGGGGARMEAGSAGRFTEAEVEAVRREADAVRYITPLVRTSAQIKFGSENWLTSVYGAYPEYLQIRQWNLISGTPLSLSDERSGSKTCLMGQTVADNLFGPGADPVGRTTRINNLPFRVAGLLESKGQSSIGQDQDDILIAPYSTVQKKILGGTYAQSLFASARSENDIPYASQQIEEVLLRRMRVPAGDGPASTLRTQTEIT